MGHNPDMNMKIKINLPGWPLPRVNGAVDLDDLNFRRTSFPPDEFSAGREGD